jgi:hypothetical protein
VQEEWRLWIEVGALTMAIAVAAVLGDFLIDRFNGRR